LTQDFLDQTRAQISQKATMFGVCGRRNSTLFKEGADD